MTELRASITLPQAIALYIGAVVGAGVLILPGVAASVAGPASIVAWLVDCVLGIPLALTFARLATEYPDPGGVASFTTRAFGPTTGGIVGWYYLTASIAGQIIVPLTGGYYAAAAIGWDRRAAFVLAGGILLIATGANIRGLRISAPLQLLLSSGVVSLLVLAAALSAPRWQAENWAPFLPFGLPAVGNAAVLIFVAVFGWEAVAQLSAEFEDPGRDLIRATLATVALVTILYVGIAAATIATRTYGGADLDRTAVSRLLADSLGAPAAWATGVMAIVISAGTCNAFAAATSRLMYALARDRSFPRWFAALDNGVPRRGVAAFGLATLAGLATLFAAGGDAEALLVVPSTLGLSTYVIGTAAGVRLLQGWGRALALVSLIVTAALMPFAGLGIGLAFVVAIAAAAFRHHENS
jgi:amino acid efflux transporter